MPGCQIGANTNQLRIFQIKYSKRPLIRTFANSNKKKISLQYFALPPFDNYSNPRNSNIR